MGGWPTTTSGSRTCCRSSSPSSCSPFFPDWAERFDFAGLEWLNAEVFPDPPQGERRYLDLVARLPTRQVVPAMRPGEEDAWVTVLHVEIEWPDAVAPLRPRGCSITTG